MGLDVHDTTVYPKEPLLPGMCLTMEPGLYFSKVAIDQALSDPIKRAFLVPETIAKFENFGGIRIEDDIVITETGCEVLTTVPKEIEDIEVLMAAAALSVSS
jgi:Xaa-Pro dipeptidase